MTDLLPCPFCGGPAHDQKDAAGIMCLNEGCLVRPYATSMTKAGAIKIWNNRAHLPDVPQGAQPAWPAGCHDPDSCARHKACMYQRCRHEAAWIRGEITSSVSRPKSDSATKLDRDVGLNKLPDDGSDPR